MSRRPDPLLSAALLGAASGLRSFTGVAALALAPPVPGARTRIRPGRLRTGVVLAAGGELVGDKLPQAPDRTSPPGLAGRLVFGGLCGALVSTPDVRASWAAGDDARGGVVTAAVVGVLASAATSYGGQWVRGRLARRVGHDLPVAVAEDALAAAIAVRGARLRVVQPRTR